MSDTPKPARFLDQSGRHKHFLARCHEMHGDQFDYSQFVYVDAKTKGRIICAKHGAYEQTPDKHLAKRSKGCPQCWDDMRGADKRGRVTVKRPPVTAEVFLHRARERYGDKYIYDLSGYTELTKSVITITCPDHGPFKALAANHLLSANVTGCAQCGFDMRGRSKTKSYDRFVTDAREIHGDRYDYPTSIDYQTRRSKVTIVCRKHGPFEMRAQKHLTGQRCRDCAVDDMIAKDQLIGGYSEHLFAMRPELKDIPAILYYVKINDGELFKIGITKVTTQGRMRTTKHKARGSVKSFEIMGEHKTTLYQAFTLEQAILTTYRDKRVPQPWSSEVFKDDIFPEIRGLFS